MIDISKIPEPALWGFMTNMILAGWIFWTSWRVGALEKRLKLLEKPAEPEQNQDQK